VLDFDMVEEMNAWLRSKNLPPSSPDPGDEPARSFEATRGSAAEIEQLFAQVELLTTELNILKKVVSDGKAELSDVKKSVNSGKGVSAGGGSFDSEDDIVALIEAEGIDPKRLVGGAVDFISFFSHEKDGRIDENKLTNEMRQMKMAGISNIAALRYMASFRQYQPSYFLNTSNIIVKHGDRFPMLESKTTWQGTNLIKGANIELEKTISDTSTQIDQYIHQNIPPGRLHDLSLHLNLATTRWMTKPIAYINRELKEVENYGIPETKDFTLVSNQLNTIFLSLWAKRMLMQEFSTERDETLYVARTIWVTMEAHEGWRSSLNLTSSLTT
jgi:hypothetical protein